MGRESQQPFCFQHQFDWKRSIKQRLICDMMKEKWERIYMGLTGLIFILCRVDVQILQVTIELLVGVFKVEQCLCWDELKKSMKRMTLMGDYLSNTLFKLSGLSILVVLLTDRCADYSRESKIPLCPGFIPFDRSVVNSTIESKAVTTCTTHDIRVRVKVSKF